MGESKKVILDASLAHAIQAMKDGEILSVIRVYGSVDLYLGNLKGVNFDGSGELHLSGTACERATISEADLKNHVTAAQIASISSSAMDFSQKAMIKLLAKAVTSQEKTAGQSPVEIKKWAEKLAGDLAAAGESEYGIYTTGAKPLVYPVPGLPACVLTSQAIKPGEIFVAQHSATKFGQLDITRLDDVMQPKDPEIAQFYSFMHAKNIEIMEKDWFNTDIKGYVPVVDNETKVLKDKVQAEVEKELGENEFDVVKMFPDDGNGTLAADAFCAAQDQTDHVKMWSDDGQIYVGVKHGGVIKTIAEKVDSIAQQAVAFKIADLEKKLLKINQNHPYAEKIKEELIAMKKKFDAQKNPLQVLEKTIMATPLEHKILAVFNSAGFAAHSILGADGGMNVVVTVGADKPYSEDAVAKGLAKLGFKLVAPTAIIDANTYRYHIEKLQPWPLDVDAQITHAFEKASIAVVKIIFAGSGVTATARVVLQEGQNFNVETLDIALMAIGWKRTGSNSVVQTNPDGSAAYDVVLTKTKISAAEFASAIGANEYGPIGQALKKPISKHEKPSFIQHNGKIIVTLTPDGKILFGEGVTPDGAASAFWDAVAMTNPLSGEVKNLTQKLMTLTDLNNELLRRIARYEGNPNQPTEANTLAARFGNIAGNL